MTDVFGCDESCVIEPGEHPFVKKKTVIAYEKTRSLSSTQQDLILKNPTLCPALDPVSKTLLARIQDGAFILDLTPQKYQAIIKDSLKQQQKK